MSTPFQLIVPRAIYDDMIAQARSELPNECCGILAGRITGNSDALLGEVAQCYALVNAARSPTEFLSEPKSMFEAERDKRQRNFRYHQKAAEWISGQAHGASSSTNFQHFDQVRFGGFDRRSDSNEQGRKKGQA